MRHTVGVSSVATPISQNAGEYEEGQIIITDQQHSWGTAVTSTVILSYAFIGILDAR